WTFPEGVTLPGGGYLLVWASNKDRGSATTELHTNFALSSGGEYLGLIKPDGAVASEYAPEYPVMTDDTSYGVAQPLDDAEPMIGFFSVPTPGARNGGNDSLVQLGEVTISPASRTFLLPLAVTLSGAEPGQVIRYELSPPGPDGANGRLPDGDSPAYTAPITITGSVILRAAVFAAAGELRGPVNTAHFVRIEITGTHAASNVT